MGPGNYPAPARANFAGHVRILGILWLAESVLRLVPGIFLLAVFGAGSALLTSIFGPVVPGIILVATPVLLGIGLVLFLGAIAGLVAGWGLLNRKPWARTLALILALVGLPHVPFGTALGIYTLWVLLPEDAERAYAER